MPTGRIYSMKKEVILAIVIGFGLGLVITFGVYNARKSLQEVSQIKSPQTEEVEPIATPTSILPSLSIIAPLDQSITKESKISVSGVAAPSSWIVILSEKGEKLLQADEKGSFEGEIFLISGENEIQVYSLTDKGEESSKVVTVVYSTAEI